MRILIVETSGRPYQPLFKRLSHLGHSVDIASNGDSAAALLCTFEPDVAVLQTGTSEDGLPEIAARLKTLRRGTSIIAVGRWTACENVDLYATDHDELVTMVEAAAQ